SHSTGTSFDRAPPQPAPCSTTSPSTARHAACKRMVILPFRSTRGLEPCDALVVVFAAEQLVHAMVNALLQELHVAIGEAEIRAARVLRLEPPRDIPVLVVDVRHHAPVAVGVLVIPPFVNWDDRAAVGVAAVEVAPTPVPVVVVLLGQGFPDHDRVRGAVRYRRHTDLDAGPVEHAAELPRIDGVAVVGT